MKTARILNYVKKFSDGIERIRNGTICFNFHMIQLEVATTMTLCQWRLTALKVVDVEKEAKARVKLTRAMQKASQSQRGRTQEKGRTPAMMVEATLERANQCQTRARRVEKETNHAMSVESEGTMRVTVAGIRVFETFRMSLMEAKVNQIKVKTQVNILVSSLRPNNLLQIELPNIEFHEFLS